MKGYSLISVLGLTLLGGCGSSARPPIHTVEYVDLERFMGDWHVIANIPTFVEKDAYNAVESYELADDGAISTTFTFRKGAFDGELKRYHPTGFVDDDGSNAIWRMQFVWPFKADYRIVYVDEDYQHTIVGRERRDYVWIMARTSSIPDADYDRMLGVIREQGYDIAKVQRVPQRW